MPATTPILDLPYPLGSDPIRDGDDTIQALAEQVEASFNSLTPLSYGAVGDDTTDDTAALQAALTAAASYGVAVDGRGLSYLTTDGLTAPAGTVLQNLNLRCTGTGKRILTLASDTLVRYVSVTGRHTVATAASNEVGIYAHGASAAAPLRNVRIQDCSVEFVGQNAIDLKWVTGFTVAGCRLGDLGYSGVTMLSCLDGWVVDNEIDTVLASPSFSSNGYGIIMTRAPSSDLAADPRSKNIRVRGNSVAHIPWNGIDTHAGEDLTIDGNHVYNCKFAIAIGSCPNASAVATYAPLNVTVIANHVDSLVDDGSKDTGIIFTGATGALSSDVATEYATGKIIGNTVRRHGDQANNNQGAIMFRNTSGLVVANNRIDQPSPHGICAYYDNRNHTIVGNTISDCWSNTAGVGTSSAVAARADNNTGVVSANTLRNTGAKSGASFSNSRGISQLSGSGNDWTLGPNDVTAATTQISGTGATMRMPAGSAALPGLAFAEDTDTGFYRVSGNQMGLAANGLGQLNFIDGAVITLKANYGVSCANGLQLGGAASHKLGFWGKTPVVQPSGTPAAATDPATTMALVNDLRTKLIAVGLVA